MPSASRRAPVESETPTIRYPLSWNSRAQCIPALPKPCTHTRTRFGGWSNMPANSPKTMNAPCPVALLRPAEPPTARDFPVTTPGLWLSTMASYSSAIHESTRSFVYMSGAPISRSSPNTDEKAWM